MLFRRLPDSITSATRRDRIRCLERHVRQTSNGKYKVQDYLEWLLEEHLPIPTRQTLHEDMAFYAGLCDDIEYGNSDKWLRINPSSDGDAVRWFMGAGWDSMPIRPRLSSSIARCLLMAQEEKKEVQFLYAKLEQLGKGVSQAETWRVIPHHIVPGMDSAYMGMRLRSGRIATFNLARIVGRVAQTGKGEELYKPIQEEPSHSYRIQCPKATILNQLQTQYQGLMSHGPDLLSSSIDPPTKHFLKEMFQGWAWRTLARSGDNHDVRLTWSLITEEDYH